MNKLLEELQQYFEIRELVCEHIYFAHWSRSWQFFRPELLETLLVVRRDIIKVPLLINNWGTGKELRQRGLRCNLCPIVEGKTQEKRAYLSAHVTGAAVDFDAKGMSAEEARGLIRQNQELLPYPIRLEKEVNWVHLDVYDDMNGKKINEFAAG